MRPVDALNLAYSFFMFVLILLLGASLEGQFQILIVYLGCIAFSLSFIILKLKVDTPLVRLLFNLYPLPLLIAYYEVSGQYIHLLFDGYYDHILLGLENFIFSVHPTIWLQQFSHPLLTEWMMFGYSVYLLLLPITVGGLYLRGMPKESEHMLLSLMISFFICYIVFFLIPVEGPRFAMADQYSVTLDGYMFKLLTSHMENNAMLHGGAFPSAHCAAATVMLSLSYKYDKKMFFWILPILITLYFSTIYGRYHYPSDLVAGIIAGAAGIKLSGTAQRLWRKMAARYQEK